MFDAKIEFKIIDNHHTTDLKSTITKEKQFYVMICRC